jgi:uncharacterized membrane protein
MTPELFLVPFGIAGAAIAAWCCIRFEKHAPQSWVKLILHAAGAGVAVHAVGAMIAPAVAASPVIGIVGVALPVLVYCLLVGFWTLRLLQQTFSGALR